MGLDSPAAAGIMERMSLRVAVISDVHVLGHQENLGAARIARELGRERGPWRRSWRQGLFALRRRFWNWIPEARFACFVMALERIEDAQPDLVVANGDYGGDARGVGLSDDHTLESAAAVVHFMRLLFPEKCRFVFGDHELGKYSTELRQGGIRLASLLRGERQLGIRSFWREDRAPFVLIGVNSSLFLLDLFLPEALPEESGRWRALQAAHHAEVTAAFAGLADDARVILFCHDPSALGALHEIPAVRRRLPQVEATVIGHLHTPRLLRVTRWLRHLPALKPRYPVARIVAHGARAARDWPAFRPVVCPAAFGAGQHLSGGLLLLEAEADGPLRIRRQRIRFTHRQFKQRARRATESP